MKFTLVDGVVYVLLSLIYGTGFAFVANAQAYFNSCVLISYRMLFGFGTCLIIFAVRLAVQRNYTQVVKAHFSQGIVPLIHLMIGGILFHGITQCMCAIAIQWLPSAAAQITQPISTATSTIIAHFIFADERFNIFKFYSLLCALAGVVLNAVPSFLHATSSDATKNVTIGYVVLILGVIIQGVGMVYMKWKSPNADITVQAVFQIGASAVLCFIWSLIWDSPKTISTQTLHTPIMGWVWVLIVGVVATGIAGHGFVFLVSSIGATGASFITFGQIFVGIIVGVAIYHEWAGYRWWEIFMCIVGILFLAGAIGVGFLEKKPKQELSSMSGEKKEEDQREEGYTNENEEAHSEGPVEVIDSKIAEL